MIETKNNLLAFSGGIDSTALFFKLLEQGIPFDIAIVDYGIRQQSKEEVKYAKELAKKHDKRCFVSTFPKEKSFSEKSARDFRYEFFEELIQKEGYESLITAHQLNDKFEWFLMQLTKGAGLSELTGMAEVEQREGYKLARPLLEYSKEELTQYLEGKEIKYFIDETNEDEKYRRNYFRKNFSDALLKEHKEGIKKSFEYLQNDLSSFETLYKKIYEKDEFVLYGFNGDENIAIKIIDKELKKRGILPSKAVRDEILKQKEIIVSHKIAVAIQEDKIYIAPKTDAVMDKGFKEVCRVRRIPKFIRPYLFVGGVDVEGFISN